MVLTISKASACMYLYFFKLLYSFLLTKQKQKNLTLYIFFCTHRFMNIDNLACKYSTLGMASGTFNDVQIIYIIISSIEKEASV